MAPKINYSFGWRPSKPDFRDRKFVPSRAILPASIDLDSPVLSTPFNPSYDQGNLGSCGPNSLAANLAYDEVTAPAGGPMLMPSRLFMYYWTRYIMGTVNEDSGVDNRSMLQALKRYGWCDETLCPYNISAFTQKPSAAAIAQAVTRAGGIEYLSVPQDLNTMKTCLAVDKKPIIFGFTVYSSMLTPQVDQTGDIPLPSMGDSVAGGHDILLVGFSDATQRFKIKNSWGNWGKQGYGSVPYAYATDPGLSGDFWTVRSIGGGGPPPPPPPPPPPTPTPSWLKTVLDAFLTSMAALFPAAATVIDQIKDWLDGWLSAKGNTLLTNAYAGGGHGNFGAVSTSWIRSLIDQMFADFLATIPNKPVERWIVQFLQTQIDNWLIAQGWGLTP